MHSAVSNIYTDHIFTMNIVNCIKLTQQYALYVNSIATP